MIKINNNKKDKYILLQWNFTSKKLSSSQETSFTVLHQGLIDRHSNAADISLWEQSHWKERASNVLFFFIMFKKVFFQEKKKKSSFEIIPVSKAIVKDTIAASIWDFS